jgi:hypothetical protein
MKRFDLEDKAKSEFHRGNRKNKNGTVTVYPSGPCKQCHAERKKARQAAKSIEVRRAEWRRWHANQDPEARRAYAREYSAIQRRKAGVPVKGPYRRRRRGKLHKTEQPREDKQPFLEWLEEYQAITGLTDLDIARRSGISPRSLWRARNEAQQIALDVVDRVVTALDMPDLLNQLYPLE